MSIDPQNPLSARSVIYNLLPDSTTRRVLCTFLVDAICQVHKNGEHPGVWAVTLQSKGHFVRLNVGRIETFALFPNTAHIILDYTKLGESDVEQLLALGGVRNPIRPAYQSVPCSESWNIPAPMFHTALPILWLSYQHLLEEAAVSVTWRTGYYISPSPGVMEFLRQEIGPDIPLPNYDITISIAVAQQHFEQESDMRKRKALLKRINMLQKLAK